MDNFYIKFPFLLFFICVLSVPLYAQTYSKSLINPTCMGCSDGKIDVEWSNGKRTVRVRLYNDSGNLLKTENYDPYEFSNLSGGDYTISYEFQKKNGTWNVYDTENVTLMFVGVVDYCSTFASCVDRYYLKNVNFNNGSINNTSGCDGYYNYSALSADVQIGNSYPLILSVSNPDRYNVDYRLWVDWNQDGDFVDGEEEIIISGNVSRASSTITVPPIAKIGTTRMRVKMMNVDNNDPCQSDFYYGEVEDYVLKILPKLPLVSLNIDNSSIDENGGSSRIIARLDEIHGQNVTVTLSFSGSAPVVDYLCVSQIVIPAGNTSSEIVFSAVNNTAYDGDRNVNVDIVSVDNAREDGVQQETITIVDDDLPPNLSITDISIDEGDGTAIFKASLNGVSVNDVSFRWSTSDWTAKQPGDYSRKTWTDVTIPAGQLSIDLLVTIIDDDENESDEKFTCYISNVNNAILLKDNAVCTIVDNENSASIEVDLKSPENGFTAKRLVEEVLVTGCLIAKDIKYKGDEANGLGYFNAGTSDFPLASGIILSSGKVGNAEGPNGNLKSDQNDGFDFDKDNIDTDLLALAGTEPRYDWRGRIVGWDKPYYDAQILEFDFEPAGDKIEFHYIFASEEYPNYACSNFNDGFAFIISGPGIKSDPGLSGMNIALTDSGDEVSINNVFDPACSDCPDNSNLYVEEADGFATSFNGRTKVLTAKADVEKCGSYHIKLIVYDRNDQGYNSAVFLEAKSFTSNEVLVENKLDGLDGDKEIMYRGCDKSYICFTRKERLDEEYSFNVTIGGSAINGVDYYQVSEAGSKIGNFPELITFEKGETEVRIYYVASDEVTGEKDILFEVLRGCPCSTDESDYFKKSIKILDIGEIEANAISNVTCGGGTPISTVIVQLKADLNVSNYLYALDGGIFKSENKFQGNISVGDHIVTIKDKFSCQSKDVVINIPNPTDLKADARSDFEMCEGDNSKDLNGTGGIDYLWTCDKAVGLTDMDVTSETPHISPVVPADTYTYTLTVSDGIGKACESSDEIVVKIMPTPIVDDLSADKFDICSGDEITLNASVSRITNPTYSWTPIGEVVSSSKTKTKVIPLSTLLASRTYFFEVVSENGCSAKQSISGIKVNPNPTVSLNSTESNFCSNGSNGEIKVDASGGTPKLAAPLYDFFWNSLVVNSDKVTGLAPDLYTVTVVDSKLCEAKLDIEVKVQPKPIGIFFE